MPSTLDPKVDFIFKNIFGNKSKKGVLISLLNAVISPFDGKIITGVDIDDSTVEKEYLEDKYSILDIKATLDNGSRVNIEMQMTDPGHMDRRALFYLSRLYAEPLSSGGNYNDLKKTIVINILNYNLTSNNRYHNHYLFTERQTGEVFADFLQIHTIELKKFKKSIEDIDDALESWIKFLINPTEEVVQMLTKDVPEIAEAFEILKVVSRDKKTRRDYELREKALRDRVSSESWYMEKGILQAARGMKAAGASLDLIQKATGLTKEDMEKL